ncbi:hypothetical protein [Vibrio coralliilyticus]|uniref:hypothetical protein n=1 Tax=Vibrio coralliilyticus TaxID=190893 RepID=UPI0003077069|nr:hypothetical protein [Vibrio coralliilyticus]NOH54964.1 hypothetical protein [Vibrio coralliilyticus]NOI31479.1 hypothetical protein [Vibrio coralliilyticus]NOI50899.1 hypothetical protein [Vibrio coralliilyticus]NOI60644.1 hypothetical protein [Vibrio coralliilyticus]PAT65384.1 hypothetical protein CKA27_25020 [Vibrio coralliilyticus]
MAKCVIEHSGYFISSPNLCDYMILTAEEVNKLTLTVSGPLTIDSDLYVQLSGQLLLSFVTGHVLGRIVKTMGRK